MEIIAICNQKGGVGKTSVAINLGVALAGLGKKVLLIDLDSQANLTYSFGIKNPESSIVEILLSRKVEDEVMIEKEGLKIIPSSQALSDYEATLVNKIGREQTLKDKLKGITGFDYILIDCPPALSLLTVNALNYAQEVLIPVQLEIFSLQGLTQLQNTIQEVKQVLNKDLRVRGIIPIMYDARRSLSHEVLEAITKTTNERVYKTVIRECVKICEAPSFGKSVLSYAPQSTGAVDFINLAKEFISNV
jgi:chromosome partitioning protein